MNINTEHLIITVLELDTMEKEIANIFTWYNNEQIQQYVHIPSNYSLEQFKDYLKNAIVEH
jgi:hypothetical protein